MGDKTGKQFEKLAAEIFELLRANPHYETVEQNVTLPGKDGPRKIDVLIKGRVGPLPVLVIIECKDHAKMVTVQIVDELHSKMQDVGAHQGAIVARKGFSRTAARKAKRLGITLYTAHSAESPEWEIPLALPILVEEFPSFTFHLEIQGTSTGREHKVNAVNVNGVNVCDTFVSAWNSGAIPPPDGSRLTWWPDGLEPPYYLTSDEGERVPISAPTLEIGVERVYYFGHLNKLEHTRVLANISEGHFNVFFDGADLTDFRSRFARFSAEELPQLPYHHVRCISRPTMHVGPISARLGCTE